MPEQHRLIGLIKEDPTQWPDLQHKIDLGAVEATDDVSLATIHRHAGAERVVAIRLDLPDGRAVLGEVPFHTFIAAADAMGAGYLGTVKQHRALIVAFLRDTAKTKQGAAERVLNDAANDIEQAGKQ